MQANNFKERRVAGHLPRGRLIEHDCCVLESLTELSVEQFFINLSNLALQNDGGAGLWRSVFAQVVWSFTSLIEAAVVKDLPISAGPCVAWRTF